MSSSRIYGPEEKNKLEKLISEGSAIHQEISDLQEGLRDTVKAVAEELQLKPSIINRAIKLAYKGNWQDFNADFEEIEAILDITKRI